MPEININESGTERLARNWTEYLRNNPQQPALNVDAIIQSSLSASLENNTSNTSIRDVTIEENRRINDRLNMASDPDLVQPLEHHYTRALEIMAEEREFSNEYPFINTRTAEPNQTIPRHMEINGHSVPYHSSDRIDAINLALNNTREEVIDNMRIPDNLIRPNIIIPYPTTPEKAYNYALALNAPQPDLEPLIAQSAQYSYQYAEDILKGRFELGEPSITTHPSHAFYYAQNVLRGRFLLGEPAIYSYSDNMTNNYINEFITPDLIKQLDLKRSSITNPITTLNLED